MKIDRYTKIVLTAIATALTVIAMKPLIDSRPSYAASSIEYKLSLLQQPPSASWEKSFNELGAQGWELVAIHNPSSGVSTLAVFRR